MKYISKIFIKNILSSVNIVKFISSKIYLKKIGDKYISHCPFHNDKNPSFIVNEKENFYYCFGCKKYGNSINFLMNFSNINFFESIKEISNFIGIKLNLSDIKNNEFENSKKKYYFNKLIYKLAIIYNKSLLKNKNLYFIKNFLYNRGLDNKIIKKFLLGYSSKKIINKFIYKLNKFELNFLINLGFFIKNKNGKIYDRLYNRIIFPIYNIYNKIVAFGGRILNKSNYIKYINSSNNFYFIKKNCLYNLNNIRKKCFKIDKIIVVEGYLDVITLNKFGIYYVVALLGSSICKKQIKILYIYTNNIIYCYDGDKSGIISIYKTIDKSLFYLNEINKSFFIFLPKGEDPDSIMKKEGLNKFKNRIKNSIYILNLIFYLLSKKYNLFTYNGKISFVESLLNIVNKVNCYIIKLFMYKKLSFKVGINENRFINFNFRYNYNIKKKNEKFLRYLISLLLKNPKFSFLVNLSDYLFNIKVFGLYIFLKIINFYLCNKNINLNNIIENFSNLRVKLYLEYLFYYNFFSIKLNSKLLFLNILSNFRIYLINKKINKIFLYSKYNG